MHRCAIYQHFPVLSSYRGYFVVLLCLLLVGCVACGGSQSAASQSSAAPRTTKQLTTQINPCSLLTQSQVEQVLKISLRMTPPLPDAHGNYSLTDACSYDGANGNGSSAEIFLATFADEATAKANFHQFATLNGSDFHTLAGLGEQALLVAQPVPQVFVQQDNGILTVGIASSAPASVVESQEQQLARLAVQAM